MRMPLCDCSVLGGVASEKRVDLMEVVGRSKVMVEMKRRGRDRDGSNSWGSVASDAWVECPFSGAYCLPVRFKVLENVKVPEILVLWVRFTFSGACLESPNLVVNQIGWCNSTPVFNELESSVKRNDGK